MIFNKANNGADELQQVSGIYYQSNDFRVIESEIKSACRDIQHLIGEPLYRRALDAYNANDNNPINKELVVCVQSSVASLAMSRFYQQNSLSHEDSGRRVKIEDGTEKMPWAWQVDRDDRALLDRYYRSLDALYQFAAQNEIEEWSESPLCRDIQTCIIKDMPTFQRSFPIDNSYRMFFTIVPFMIDVQKIDIEPIVKDIMPELIGADVSEEYADILYHCQRLIPLLTIISVVKRMTIRVLPDMVVRNYTASFEGSKGSNSVDEQATRHFINVLEGEVEKAKKELQRAVTKRDVNVAENLVPNNSANKKYCIT